MFGKKTKKKGKGKVRKVLDKGKAIYATTPSGILDMVDLIEMGLSLGMKSGGRVSNKNKKVKAKLKCSHNRLY